MTQAGSTSPTDSKGEALHPADSHVVGSAPSADVLGRLPVALLLVSEAGLVTFANHAAESALGRARGTVAGRVVDEVLAPIEELWADDDRADRCVSVRGPHGTSSRFGYSITDLPRGATHDPRFAIVFRDITRSANVTPERDRLLHLASMGAAVPSIVHDMKNSLAALTMGLGVLSEDVEDEEQRAQAAALAQEAEHVARTLDGFGAFGREPRSRRACSLQRTLDEARHALEFRAQKHDIEIDWSIGPLESVFLDPALLHALLFNLATNAIQATEQGGRIHVALAVVSNTLRLSVEDWGEGMKPDVAARCTELFYSTQRRRAGIGLSLCNEAVRAANGELSIDSALHRGTRVSIEIPRATTFER